MYNLNINSLLFIISLFAIIYKVIIVFLWQVNSRLLWIFYNKFFPFYVKLHAIFFRQSLMVWRDFLYFFLLFLLQGFRGTVLFPHMLHRLFLHYLPPVSNSENKKTCRFFSVKFCCLFCTFYCSGIIPVLIRCPCQFTIIVTVIWR